jgi:hypothetical protein
MPTSSEELTDLINLKIETLRPRLLDLSRRNPLISTKLTSRSNSHVRVVDKLPDVLFYNLGNSQEMRFVPLPPLEDDPRDEQTETFSRALANARLTDPDYLTAAEEIDSSSEDYLDLNRKIERALKDKVRAQLGLAARPEKVDVNLVQHAKNNGISPSYDLPAADGSQNDESFSDLDIQTLLLPKDLERKLSALNSKCNTWIQETGINVLHGAFGFLEWAEPNTPETSFAPLILLQVKFSKRKTKEGLEFWVSGLGEDAEINTVLSEKLRLEFGIELPMFEGGSVESYLKDVAKLSPKSVVWRVRRQVVFGVFPSARMAMYHDLNTETADFAANGIIRPLFGGNGADASSPFADEYFIDEPAIERLVPSLVLDADASQFSTLVDVANGKNVAVEGPPGTGKSQTIVNTIAAALAAGKKVLFIAEKMAALDVVRSRLEAIKLGEFLLPLQAERSTRENVIQSIRDRLEMSPVQQVHYYDEQVRQFREARDETALYIKALSHSFEDSGLTVHEILGKSIATADRLAQLPKALQLAPFPLCQGFSLEVMKTVSRKAGALHDAWQKASGAPPFWAGVQTVTLNRFDAEEILELATTHAQWLTKLDEMLCESEKHNLTEVKLPDRLPELAAAFDKALALKSLLHLALVPKLTTNEMHAAFQTFLNDCRSLQEAEKALLPQFSAELTQATIEVVTEITALCADHGLSSVNFQEMGQSITSKRQAIGMARKLAGQMRPFADQVPGSDLWRFGDVGRMRDITAQAGHHVILARNSAMAEPTAPSLLKALNVRGRQLAEDRVTLSEHFSFAESVPLDRLIGGLAILKRAGTLRAFSLEYRRAKKFYLRLSSAKFRRTDAIASLERLAEWKKRETDFVGDIQAARLYGIHFRGIETDFDFFGSLADFYENVCEKLARIDQKPIRDFLLLADVDVVTQIPVLEAYPDTLYLKSVDEGIERLERELAAKEKAYARLRELAKIFTSPADIAVSSLSALRESVSRYLTDKHRLDGHSHMSTILEASFVGSRTDAEPFRDLVDVCGAVAALGPSARQVATFIAAGHAELGVKLAGDLKEAFDTVSVTAQEFDKKTGLRATSVLKAGSHSDRARSLQMAAQDEDGLYAHSEFARAKADVDCELHNLVDAYFAAKGDYAELGEALEALAIRSLARRAYEKHGGILSRFPGSKLNDLRKKVARLDRNIIEASRQVLRARIKQNAKPPRGNGVGKKSSFTELALIENEASKKQRYIPVRDLTRRAGIALQELKPCWMMSPLAVAQYLPRGHLSFDLCIFDEASQMTPENAVGALARSQQAMVVGDTNQLPPSNFFRKMIDDEDVDEDESVLSESILEMANATFRPARRLRWHYRSRHSGLIRFSNRLVYNDDLVVFPSATESMPGMGVEFRAVEGLYKSGTNAVEAREMVETAIWFMKNDPNRSLGIVTLNQKQRELIFEEMEYALSRDPAAAGYVEDWGERNDGLEQFFIKNLENVQGDERDVIFIGTVYGPEQPGARVMQRFGPINGVAGKRRLNVLFSRAKQQIVTFSSMRAGDITAEPEGNEGAYMLKRWLEYCATGVLDAGDLTHKEPDSDFELFVMAQIWAMGCTPVPQVGVKGYSIDIGVKHPQWAHGFILGVECDGASFHSSKSARDRDRLRQEVLEGLGWRFHRIWSTDWFNNPGKQAEILRSVIADRLAELKAKEAQFTARQSHRAPKPDIVVTPAAPKPETPMTVASLYPVIAAQNGRSVGIAVGDTVRLRYLTDDKRVVQFTISAEQSDPANGVIYYKKPIAEALLGAEEGEEVEVLVGSYLRQAVVEKILNRLN